MSKPTATPSTALAVMEQPAEGGVVEWSLDAYPADMFNQLVPVSTLQIPTDLLRPVVQIVKLSPNPLDGDVYSSKDMPDGHAAPTRVGLRKFATAAGISFVDERRVDDGRDTDVIEVTCIAEMLLPTGQRIRATGTKRIDLNAQVWRSPEHRGKFKSFFQEHVASRAQNRAIRALLSLRGSYPTQLYQRPFAVVSFAPNMAHPEVRSRILDAMAGTSAQLYGPAAAAQIGPGQTIDVTPAAEDDPAPAPAQLPGERLAKAQGGTGQDPDWFAGGALADASDPTLATKLRDNAEASGMAGSITVPQKGQLQEILKPLGLASATAGLQQVFGVAIGEVTAAQAQATINLANSVGVETFREEWTAMVGVADR